MKKTIRGILFDKDGTLLDYHQSWSSVNQKAAIFAASGQPNLAKELLHTAGIDPDTGITRGGSALAAGNTEDICKLWVESGSRIPYDVLCTEIDRIFVDAAECSVPVARLGITIEQLIDQGYILGVASSDSQAAVEAFLKAQNLQSQFSFISGYDSGYGHKPDSGMLLGFCDKMHLLPEEVAVVGDNTQDLEMARAGGAALGIGVLTGTSSKETLLSLGDFVFESISELNTLKTRLRTEN